MPSTTISKTVGQVTELTVIAPLKAGAATTLRQVLGALTADATWISSHATIA
jgi:hypothetical protein